MSGRNVTNLHINVWYAVARSWKALVLSDLLCSSRNGSNTTPSRTGNVIRSSAMSLSESAFVIINIILDRNVMILC